MRDPRHGRSTPRRVGGDGAPDVFCADEQSDVPLDAERWRTLALDVLADEGVRGWCELALLFVDERTMSELNGRYMGKQGPTDVLAFPLDAVDSAPSPGPGAQSHTPERRPVDPGDHPLLLGDVVVCPSVALRQAASHAGTPDDEIALLVVHGMLHVLGMDHDTPETTAAMHRREREILERRHWRGPAPDAFRHVPEPA
jgi:probable rRNA maturation factor